MPRSVAVAPTTSAGGTPSTTTSTTGGDVIVIVTARARPATSATTTAVPRRRADNAPVSVTAATAGLRDFHVTGTSTGLPWRSSARAASVARVPDRTSVGTSTSIVATLGATTTTSTLARASPAETVTVAEPGAFAVRTPAESTVATRSFDDRHTRRAPSTRPPVSERGTADSTMQSP